MIYLTATMTLGTLSICLTVLVLNVHHRGAERPVPRWLRTMALYYMARMLLVRTTYRRKHQQQQKHQRDNGYIKSKALKFVVDGNGVMDEMEMLNLTLNSRQTNGPRSLGLSDGLLDNNCTPRKDPNRNERRGSTESEPEDFCKEWQEIACVMDRLFFWILFLSMTGSALFILLFPKYTGIEGELLKPPSH